MSTLRMLVGRAVALMTIRNNKLNDFDCRVATCQNVIVNSLEDFCLWGPPSGPTSVGETEEIEVAYCTQATHGARVMPAGTITGAHYLE